VSAPRRPALRWHGGKWLLAPWIIEHLPPHQVYVEPFGGAASVLMRKSPCYAEVYNDLDGDVVNLFRVLQNAQATTRLVDLLRLTPFARDEFELAYLPARNRVERARRLVIRSFMGFGSNGHNPRVKTGFRANSNRSGTTPARDWLNYPDNLAAVAERLRGVVVESRAAVEVMLAHDGPNTLHYVDPPYLPETRSLKNPYDLKYRGGKGTAHRSGMYAHEMTSSDHEALLETLLSLGGMVVLSGYPSPLYEEALSDWRRIERAALADGARERTEVLWINPLASERLGNGLLARMEAA
jgi:DNA adenine methylase